MDPDFLVIGAGVAGLRAAIELAPAGRVLVVAKESLHESASEYAQGGIAAALADDDEIGLHESDTIYAGDGKTCLEYGVDLGRQAAPVAPAAHYAMGGVRTDLDGRSTIARLFAAGEVTSTGVHGANRLASNSLLEGVVFGARAGRAMREGVCGAAPSFGRPPESAMPAASVEEIRRLAWENCGIVRNGSDLGAACARLERDASGRASDPRTLAAGNLRDVVLLIARAAPARLESRGAHYRIDYPDKSAEFAKHSITRRGREIEFRRGNVARAEV
ncbi:MAG: FAD-binding protein [Bryobacteraceae bacterium]|jgi:L-aspartate oxidase